MKPSLRSLHYSTNGEFKIFFSFSSRYHAGNWAPAIIDLLWAARTGERVPIQSSTLTKLQRHRKSFFPGGGRGRLFFTHKERRGGGICMLLGKEWEIGTCKKRRKRKIRNIYSRYVCGKWTQEQIPYPYLGACTKGENLFSFFFPRSEVWRGTARFFVKSITLFLPLLPLLSEKGERRNFHRSSAKRKTVLSS